MVAFLLDWLNLLLRWAHLAAGIAWIGASLYVIWLDRHLEPPQRQADRERGVRGELWTMQDGALYQTQQHALAPQALPDRLHTFKWEAYWTWITGFALLVAIYYVKADLYLVDASVMPLSQGQAVGLGLGTLIGGLGVYEALCRSPLGRSDRALAAAGFLLLTAAAWGLTQVFSGRGAFIHFGAMLGTIMVGNVAHAIIPGQRKLIRAMQEGCEPDPKHARAVRLRSLHNTYLILPVLFTMISGHYVVVFGSRWSWLVLLALTLSGTLIRAWFVMRHKGSAPAWPLAAALIVLAATVTMLAPRA